MKKLRFILLIMASLFFQSTSLKAQFTSGSIPMCDTTDFTWFCSNSSNIIPFPNPGYTAFGFTLNITTNHPQTLKIILKSPAGTQLILSAFNGAGGVNYTNTSFAAASNVFITNGSAPFTGTWAPQGSGGFYVFNNQSTYGTWHITVIDTACSNVTSTGTPNGWTNGYFSCSSIDLFNTFTVTALPDIYVNICNGDIVDLVNVCITNHYVNGYPHSSTGQYVTTTSTAGTFYCSFSYSLYQIFYYYIIVSVLPKPSLGQDQTINICGSGYINLDSIVNNNSLTKVWKYNGSVISTAAASIVSTSGNYQLIGTNSSGCSDTVNFTVNFSPAFSIGADQNDSVCQGLPVNLDNYYNTTGLTSNWYYNNSLFTNTNAATNPGTYTLIASNSIGCKDTAHVNLSTYFGSSLGSDIVKNICSGTTTDLTTLINTTGTSTSNWCLGNAPIPNPVSVSNNGLYSLIATYPNGCLDTANINLNTLQNNVLGADQTVNICSYDAVNLNNNFTALNNTIVWYVNSQIVSNPSSISTAGYYTIIATDTNGCQDSSHKDVIINNTPNLGIDQTISGCYTGPLNLTQLFNTTGYNNTWYSAGSIISTPINVMSNGIYTIISTINTCSDTATVTVNNNPKPSLGLDQTIRICGQTTTNLNNLYFTGTNSTVWYYNNSPQSSVTAVSDTGLYTLIETNNFGCSDTANVNLQLLPTPSLGNDITIIGCYTGGVDLTQQYNTVGFTTNWYLGTSTISNPINILINGTYTLIATNNFGCRDTANIAVNINQNPLLGNDQTVSYCEGTTLDLNTLFNISTNTATWYFGGSLTSSAASQAGLYSLIATTNAGCTDTANVTVSLFLKPSLGNDLNINVCSNLTDDLTSYFNTAAYNTSWEYNGSAISNPTSVNSSGNYTLYVVDNNGCLDTASIYLNQLSSPQLGIDLSETICSDSIINLNSLINTTNLSGNWTNNNSTITNVSNITNQGIYNFIGTNSDGCKDTVNVSLAVNAIPNPGPSQTLSMCQGQSLNLNSYFNIGNETVLWNSNGIVIADATNIQNSGIYDLQLTNSNGCIANSTATVTVLPKPEIGPSQTIAICSGSSIDLTNQFILTGLISSWEFNSNSIADPINANQAGSYQVISTNPYGCSDTAQINLNVNISPDLGPDLSYSLCQWQTLDLSALANISGVTTQYYFNGNAISNFNAVSDSGEYQIIVTDVIGCTDSLNVSYEQIQCICATDFRFNSTCIEDPIQFEIIADSAIVNTHWHFTNSTISSSNEINPVIKLPSANEVTVTLEAELSCGTDTVTKTITFENCAEKCRTFIPQAFTPNEDGLNDVYQIVFNCEPEFYKLVIQNRYGQVLFVSKDYHTGWNGLYNGILVQDGIFIYNLEYTLPYQNKEIRNGTFLIAR